MKFLKLLIVSLLVGVGVYFLLAPKPQHAVLSPIAETQVAAPTQKIPPSQIRIPSLSLDIPVKSASVNGNTWDMFDDAIAWLSTSAVPGQGNVIMYGHNRKNLFLDLYTLKIGDMIEVEHNGIWQKYSVIESRAVKPNDVASILSNEDRLTLYTCEGNFDQKRRVLYATPI